MAGKFDVEEFVAFFEASPSESKLNALKRADLFDLAKYYNVSVIASMRKADLKAVLLEFFVDEGILEPQTVDQSQFSEEAAIRLKELELQIQIEQRKKAEVELGLAKLMKPTPQTNPIFDPSKHIRLVPPFQDKEIDKYFAQFEKVADRLQWPSDMRTLLLQSVLTGKAQEVYSALPVEQSKDYGVVKSAILKAYEQVPEAYRQRFRNAKKQDKQCFVEFSREKEILFDRWCNSCSVGSDFAKLRQVMLLEDFKSCVPDDVKIHLEEQQVKELHQAARLADDYVLTHKKNFAKGSFDPSRRRVRNSPPRSYKSVDTEKPDGENSGTSAKRDSSNKPTVTCSFCKKSGHIKSNCYAYMKKLKASSGGDSKPVAFTKSVPCPTCPENDEVKGSLSDISEGYLPFITEGFVSLGESDVDLPHYPVVILRDTGASQSLLLEGSVPLSEQSYSGTNVLVTGVGNEFMEVPLHHVNLQSDLVSGPMTVGVTPSLPKGLEGVTLLLGNDVAGRKVVVEPVMEKVASSENNTAQLEEDIPGIFPSCVTTRSMTSKDKLTSTGSSGQNDGIDLSDTFITNSMPLQENSSDVQSSISGDLFISREDLITEQRKDPTLISISRTALSESESSKLPVCYFIRNGVLMRKWRPPYVSADEEWKVIHQVVVPKPYQSHIMSLAHDIPMAGHLGVTKTCDRILQHFYWPNFRRSVADYCKTCHTCQVIGKPKQDPPKAPLKPIPTVEEPFSRVIVDCVGPLPKAKSGHQYILTIMCSSTRYVEAVPLRSIKAKPVSEALISFFTRFGLPKIVQSDQGSNFTSKLFRDQLSALGIDFITSSAYHPQSQGALERFHQTLKTMIKAYCVEHNRDWNEGLPLLLFAIREVPNESLGFSPFELVFGRNVRGPLTLVKEKWLGDDENSDSVLNYVVKLKERLKNASELARNHLQEVQEEMKVWYDRKARGRSFNPGDQVLVLLPIIGQPLQARYSGPYVIERKVGDLDYIVKTPDRRKKRQLCHINMLKSYHVRSPETTPETVALSTLVNSDEVDDVHVPGDNIRLNNSQILANLDVKLEHLNPVQKAEMSDLLIENRHLFSDVPTKTDIAKHDVDVGNAKPIKQHPYRCGPVKQSLMEKEIQYMKENDIIEESNSSWSSPCILVPKSDGSVRFCTDFRKVNSVTKPDNYPIPRVDDYVDKIGSAKFVSTYDLLKGYWQVPLTARAKEISAFVTPQGLYQYKVLPFGMMNAPATFQRIMNQVTTGLQNTEVYIDDIVIYSDT